MRFLKLSFILFYTYVLRLLSQIGFQQFILRVVSESAQGFLLDLPYTLPRQVVLFTNFIQGHFRRAVYSEECSQHLLLLVGEQLQYAANLRLERFYGEFLVGIG